MTDSFYKGAEDYPDYCENREPEDLPWDNVVEDTETLPLFGEEDSLASNYLADDCTVHCGLCDTLVNPDGLCPHCDSHEIARREERCDSDDNPERP